uniref:G_PROTEIN_RECEP_F1_2 domain-containing protein n=1 Tax=Steinernema glaseri TaxID=37863 RepID=A0A1I7YVG1_9BILA
MFAINTTPTSERMVEHVVPFSTHNDSGSMEDCDGCVHQINISESVPLPWALVMYGYVMPVLVAVTVITNSFIVIVLYQKHLRTPTNYILLSMAVTDLLTGLTSVPWFIYYYTLHGYLNDMEWGLVPFWCHAHPYLSQMIPTIWHTAAIWLTVYLAIQRYVYVCVPSSVHLYCTPRTTKLGIFTIVLLAFISEIPELFGKYMEHVVENNRAVCNLRYAPWVLEVVGVQLFYSLYYWFRVTFVHGIPCFLLLIFTCKLGRTIKAAEIRKRSWVANNIDATGASVNVDHRRGSVSSGSGRSLYATNRMLSVICSVFLSLEIPAAIIFALHFLTASHMIPSTSGSYHLLNILLMIRNILIILTSPLQFTIYCSMSEQFRLTVRQLFSTRLLFVAQAQATFHGGKRYSLILVDVELLDPKSLITRRSLRANDQRRAAASATLEMNKHAEPFRKQRVGRQVSFPNEVIEREENI